MVEGTTECVISRPMAFILRMSRLFGCADLKLEPLGSRYYIARTTKSKFRFSSIFILLLNFTVTLAHLREVGSIEEAKSNPLSSGNNSALFLSDAVMKILITTIATTDELGRMKRLIQYFNSMKQVHKGLNEVHKKMFYDQTSRYNYENRFGMLMTCFIFLYGGWFTLINPCLFLTNQGIPNATFTYVYVVCALEQSYLILVEAQILFVITTSYSTIQELNRALAEFNTLVDATDNFTYLRSWKYFEIFNELRDSYVSILDTVRRIKRNEGGVLLLILFQACIHLNILVYISAKYFNESDHIPHYTLRCLEATTTWTLLIINLALMIDPCHLTQQAVAETKGIVGGLICKSSSCYTFSMDLKIFCKQLYFQPAAYTVLDICTLERSLITTIFTAITTNLVTLLQL